MESVQAISDEGHLNITDTIQNKGLAAFFDNLDSCVGYAASQQQPDTTIHDLQPSIRNYVHDKQGPLLTASVRKWHQDSPYNMNCPDYFTSPKKVGCIALSAAQIMSYHKWPDKIDNHELDWDLIRLGNKPIGNLGAVSTTPSFEAQSEIAFLLATLGSPDYFNLCYYYVVTLEDGTEEYATGGSESYCIPTFEKLGYKQLQPATQFSEKQAYFDLKEYGPLLIYSSISPSIHSSGHAWVIDGFEYTHYEQWERNIHGDYYWKPFTSYLFHCIWGEKDLCNGYFRWNSVENYIGGDDYVYKETDDRNGKGTKLYNIHYYTNFQKDI